MRSPSISEKTLRCRHLGMWVQGSENLHIPQSTPASHTDIPPSECLQKFSLVSSSDICSSGFFPFHPNTITVFDVAQEFPPGSAPRALIV